MSTTRTLLLVLSLKARSSADRTQARDARRREATNTPSIAALRQDLRVGRGSLERRVQVRSWRAPSHAQQRIEDDPGHCDHQQ